MWAMQVRMCGGHLGMKLEFRHQAPIGRPYVDVTRDTNF